MFQWALSLDPHSQSSFANISKVSIIIGTPTVLLLPKCNTPLQLHHSKRRMTFYMTQEIFFTSFYCFISISTAPRQNYFLVLSYLSDPKIIEAYVRRLKISLLKRSDNLIFLVIFQENPPWFYEEDIFLYSILIFCF